MFYRWTPTELTEEGRTAGGQDSNRTAAHGYKEVYMRTDSAAEDKKVPRVMLVQTV